MKKYFAKDLPVEGEIREGNHFDSVNGELPGSLHTRLFLCSRDIQVGDRCYPSTEAALKDYDIEVLELNINELKSRSAFKKIGEISPGAIWVKEGDEFDEEEVRWGSKDSSSFIMPIERTKSKFDFIKILGPCKHFH